MEFTAKDIWNILRAGIVWLLIFTLLGGTLLGAFTYFFVEPEYTAIAKMYVYNEKSFQEETLSASDVAVSKSLVETYLIIIKSKPVMREALEIFKQQDPQKYEHITLEELYKYVDGEAIDDTETFTITAQTKDAKMSADIVNAIISAAPAGIERIVKGASAEIIEPAEIPTSAHWPMVRNVILGAMIGFLITAICLFLKAFLDSKTIHGVADLAKSFDKPIIGVIPENGAVIKNMHLSRRKIQRGVHMKMGDSFIINEDTLFAVVEAYRSARTNLFYLAIESKCRKIAFTSAVPGEGKTINSINIAALLVQAGKKVLLVDADMREPKIRSYLDIGARTGLSEYLAGITEQVEVVRSEKIGADVITSGNGSLSPAELLGTPRMTALISRMQENYDYIIIDTPPVNYVTDAVVISGLVDGYVVSLRTEYSHTDDLREAFSTLDAVGAAVFGTMVIGIDPKTDSHGRYHSRGNKKYGYGAYGYRSPRA